MYDNLYTLLSMAHLGARAFDSIGGEVVSTSTFVLANAYYSEYKGAYVRLIDGNSEVEKYSKLKEAIQNPNCDWFFRASAADFKKIPGSLIAYWVSENFTDCFTKNALIGDIIELKAGLSTGDNTIFQRYWYEIPECEISFNTVTNSETENNRYKWYPCHSGGEFRKWYGNHSVLVNWENNGVAIRKFGLDSGKQRSAIRNETYYFKEGITWSKISSGKFAARWRPEGFLFDDTGRCGFAENIESVYMALGLFCSTLSNVFLKLLCPTLDELVKSQNPQKSIS